MELLRKRWPAALTYTQAARRDLGARRTRLALTIEGLLLLVGIWAALTVRLPGEYGSLAIGQPSPYSIAAPTSATFVSEIKTAEARAQAESRVENLIFRTDPQLPASQRRDLLLLLDTIGNVRTDPSLDLEERFNQLLNLPSTALVIEANEAEGLLALDDRGWGEVRTQALSLYDRALAQYGYAIDEKALAQLNELSLPYWSQISGLDTLQQELSLDLAQAYLLINRTLDEVATAQRKAEAVAAVRPVEVNVLAGESIVRTGEIVTPEKIEKLQATGALPRSLNWLLIVGRGLLAAVMATGFMLYLRFFQTEIARKPRTVLVILALLLTAMLGGALLMPIAQDRFYAIPIATVAIVLAVVFNGRLALASAAIVSGVIAIAAGDSLSLAFSLLVGSAAAAFIVRDAERLLTFLLAGIAVAFGVITTQLAFWFGTRSALGFDDLVRVMPELIFFGGLNGFLSAVLALGLFNLVGRAAGVVTPLQLMELAHPSRPLLRRLIRDAPGTYYHSVAVGNLAEAAAEAIGADSLLLRVAAYYHDIGKGIRPYFFTDNQVGRENVHNDLDPATSAQIIVDHVREGVKLARAEGLPEQIIGFIATHHGTSLIRHFYQQALQDQDTVNEDDFRYPGPRPRNREEGILMLADSVEATVRSKAQNGKLLPSKATAPAGSGAQTLDDLVGSIIDARVREGELDDAPLTIRDLQMIKQTFVNSLQSIYHPRVDYAPQIVKT